MKFDDYVGIEKRIINEVTKIAGAYIEKTELPELLLTSITGEDGLYARIAGPLHNEVDTYLRSVRVFGIETEERGKGGESIRVVNQSAGQTITPDFFLHLHERAANILNRWLEDELRKNYPRDQVKSV